MSRADRTRTDHIPRTDRRHRRAAGHDVVELRRQIDGLWARGWQPADLERLVARHLGAPASDLLALLVSEAARAWAVEDRWVPPRWDAQLRAVGRAAPATDTATWLAGRSPGGPDRLVAGDAARDLVDFWRSLPDLPSLDAGPETWRRQSTVDRPRQRAAVDPGMLQKVRALLAKAESTAFEEEALAFSTKAQELMARHAIDQALLASATTSTGGAGPAGAVGRRIGIEDPYAAQKYVLAQVVAEANGCRAVYSKGLGFATVFGFESDLDLVELLLTSLLVQATNAMVAAGPQRDVRGRSRTRSFRTSFLAAYGQRIGQRLRAAREATVLEASHHNEGVLPVLASREAAVQEVFAATFPQVTYRSARVSHRGGWLAGQLAAEQADLAAGERLEGRTGR
jgi:hypothetical protein